MNMAEVAAVAYRAGIRDVTDLGRAVAIAYAESGGNPRAHNNRPPDDSYGLWQINMLGNLGPARRKQFGISSNAELFDPATNAKAMVAISGGGKNWRPWTTYGGIRYLGFLPAANAAAAGMIGLAPGVDAATGAVDKATEPIREGVAAVVKGGEWLSDRNNWFRIGKVAVGAALIMIGLGKVAAPITGSVTSVVPVGKVAKLAGGLVKK